MKEILIAFAAIFSLGSTQAFALSQEEIEKCNIPSLFRFKIEEVKVVGHTKHQGKDFLMMYFSGKHVNSETPNSFPAVYSIEGGLCSLVYLNSSGHDTPLNQSVPEPVAESLLLQASKTER